MIKVKVKFTAQQIFVVIQCLTDQAADFKDWDITRVNIYRLYSMHELERKFQSKLFTDKTEANLKLTIAEVLTLRDVLKDYNESPEVSGMFMKLDKLLPPQIK